MGRRPLVLVMVLGASLALAMAAMDRSSALAQEPTLRVTDVAAGQFLSCGLIDDGTDTEVRCWGGIEGRAGTTVPVLVDGLAGAIQVDVGLVHACAVLGDGSVACWGNNGRGQLGDGSLTTRTDPTAVVGPSGVVEVGAGYQFTCARAATGSVWCWGDNGSGQLGDGTTGAATTPVPVDGLTDAVAIDVGSSHACAVRAAGSVVCWGFNADGQLGDGTTTSRSIPVPVAGIVGATAVDGGDRHTCALLTGGTVRCWGANDRGLLGDGTDLPRSGPVEVAGIGDAVEVATGHTHSCAVLASGSIRCWGANDLSLLGDGDRTSWSPPVEAVGITDASAVDVGFKHTCATGPTEAWCWGTNVAGQLGTGDRADRSTPTTLVIDRNVTVIGGLVRETSGVPVDRVTVDLFSEGRGEYLGSTTTAGDGTFRFDPDPGCYVVTIIAPGGTTFVGGAAFATTDVCVAEGEARTDIEAILVDDRPTDAAIVGGVRFEGPGNLPANGVVVDLFTSDLNGTRLSYLRSTTSGPTDGEFAFRGLEPGCYAVTFIAPDGTLLRGPDGEQQRWLNASRCLDAGDNQRINARLIGQAEQAAIEVRGEETDGSAAVGVQVDLFVAGADGTRSSFVRSADTGGDGVARFDVAPGCYVVVAIAPDGRTFDSGSPWYERGRCVEADETATDLVAVLG